MPKKPTPADAKLILKLYDLRRERKSAKRATGAGRVLARHRRRCHEGRQAMGTQKNNWLGRWQAIGARRLAGGPRHRKRNPLPGTGVQRRDVPHLRQAPSLLAGRPRENAESAAAANVEKIIKKSKANQERLKAVEQRLAARRQQMKEGAVRK